VNIPFSAAVGATVELRLGGRRFVVRERTLRDEADFGLVVAQRRRAEIDELRPDLDAAEYQHLVASHHKDVEAGLFEWPADAVLAHAVADDGKRQLGYYALNRDDDAIAALWNDPDGRTQLLDAMSTLNDLTPGELVPSGGGVTLTPFQCVVLLHDAGYTREEAAQLPRRFVRALLAVDREDGVPTFLKRKAKPPADPWADYLDIYIQRGLPRHVARRKVEELKERYCARRK